MGSQISRERKTVNMGSQRITITVSQQAGVGHYQTVQHAVNAVSPNNTFRTVIRVMPGVYRHPVHVPKNKNKITLAGLGPENTEKTVLTFDNTARKMGPAVETYAGGTVIVEGEDFIAKYITFENSAPQPDPQDNEGQQAVAVRVAAAFYNCRFLGWQDTLYLHSGKQYLRDCYIEGSVDFIFGFSAALFEHCHIHCKSNGFITAHGRKKSNDPTGFVFLRCDIKGNESGTSYTYLGRPWKAFARVVFAYSSMDTCVRTEGWDNWEKKENEGTACFREYQCSGLGSSMSNRVGWVPRTPNDIEQYLADGSPWMALRTVVNGDI